MVHSSKIKLINGKWKAKGRVTYTKILCDSYMHPMNRPLEIFEMIANQNCAKSLECKNLLITGTAEMEEHFC